MGEEMVANSIPNLNNTYDNEDNAKEEEMNVDPNEDEINSEEYASINNKIDELNNVLDLLEKKNDDIHAQLLELLKSSQQFRQEIRQTDTANKCEDTEMKESN